MAETLNDATTKGRNADNMRVRLSEAVTNPGQVVDRTFVCYVTPDIAEAQSVNYKSYDPVHAPGSIMSYVNTTSRTFSLSNVKLISRTKQEADHTHKMLNLLRSWTKPVFGLYTNNTDKVVNSTFSNDNVDVLGAPPRVLLLSAYSVNTTGLINSVPVVVTSLTFSFPSDVDYIPNREGVPIPVMMNVDLSLTETHSPVEYSRFSIADYRKGSMVGF